MADALEAGYDLSALALCFLALGLLLAVKGIFGAVAAAFDVSIFGLRPFHSIATALENHVIAALDDAIRGVEKLTAKFESGLIDSFGLLIAIPALLAAGTKAAFEYLWNSALRPVVHSIADPIRNTAAKALSQVDDLAGTVADNLAAAERYARDRGAQALQSAEAYADRRIDAAIGVLRGDIAAGVHEAEAFAEQAVGRLRAAEDGAVAQAVALAAEAKAAGQAAAAAAGTEAEGVAAAALATADTAGKAALAAVKSIAVTVEDDLATVEGALGAAGLAALIASIPALATIVRAIATEAGLENAECRGKVKGICGTDPAKWENLLGGLTLVTGLLSLEELVRLVKPLLEPAAALIREAA